MLSWNYCPSKSDRVGLGSKKKIKIFVDRLPSARRQGKELVFFSTLLISWIFQILKDDVVKVLHSICPQIWKTQQWPWHWKRSVFIPIPKKGSAKDYSNYHTIALISHASKVMLKILQARLAFGNIAIFTIFILPTQGIQNFCPSVYIIFNFFLLWLSFLCTAPLFP